MMAAEYTWIVCDGEGVDLVELFAATGKRVTYRRSWFTEASCTLDVEDDAALLIGETMLTSWPRLKIYRRAEGATSAELIFYGHFAAPRADAAEGSSMQLVAHSPFGRLAGGTSGDQGFVMCQTMNWGGVADAGGIAFTLLSTDDEPAAAGAPYLHTKLVSGVNTATSTVTILLERGRPIAPIIVDLSNRLDGFDFTERFSDVDPDIMAYLDISDHLGVDRPDAKFEYGHDTLANIEAVSGTLAPPVNAVRIYGAAGPIQVTNSASIGRYGRFPLTRTLSDISDTAAIEQLASSLLRPNPVWTYTFVPEVNAPRAFDDFRLGDTCPVYINRGVLQADTEARINGFTVVIDEDGYEASEIPDPTLGGEDASLSAGMEVAVSL